MARARAVRSLGFRVERAMREMVPGEPDRLTEQFLHRAPDRGAADQATAAFSSGGRNSGMTFSANSRKLCIAFSCP